MNSCSPTLHLKWKSLVTNSPEKLQHVLDTINPNWFCPWSPFCRITSLSPLKSTLWQRPWSKRHWIKKLVLQSNVCFLIWCIFDHSQCPLVDFLGEREVLQQNRLQGQNQFGFIVSRTCCNFSGELVTRLFHFKWEKLKLNSSKNSEHVFDIINQN